MCNTSIIRAITCSGRGRVKQITREPDLVMGPRRLAATSRMMCDTAGRGRTGVRQQHLHPLSNIQGSRHLCLQIWHSVPALEGTTASLKLLKQHLTGNMLLPPILISLQVLCADWNHPLCWCRHCNLRAHEAALVRGVPRRPPPRLHSGGRHALQLGGPVCLLPPCRWFAPGSRWVTLLCQLCQVDP